MSSYEQVFDMTCFQCCFDKHSRTAELCDSGTIMLSMFCVVQDRSISGVRSFLSFTLTAPAVVYIAYDRRLRTKPVWLLYFSRVPGGILRTTECEFELWQKVSTVLVQL